MKEVCQQTGLTDRTVRYYIECGLLTPNSKDNYAGRKNYTFTREDVERLEQIKTLRGAGFGVEQIKALFASRSTKDIVSERLQELESEREKSEQLLEILQKADIDREVSLEELTIILSSTPTPVEEFEQEPEKPRRFPYWILWGMDLVACVALALIVQSRFSWIVEPEQYYWLHLVSLISLIAWFHRAHWKRYAAVIGICLIIPFISVVCGFIHCPAMMDETHYALVEAIPWNDTEFLLQHGFVEYDTGSLSYCQKVLEHQDLENDNMAYWEMDVRVRNRNMDPSNRDILYGSTGIDEILWVSYEDMVSKWLRRPSSVEYLYYINSEKRFITFNVEDKNAPFHFSYLEEFLRELAADAVEDTIVISDEVSFDMSPRQLKTAKGEPREISKSTVSPHLWYDYTERIGGFEANVRYTFLNKPFSKSLTGVNAEITIDDAAHAKELFDELYQALTQHYETYPYYYNDGIITENEHHYYASLGTNEGVAGVAVDITYEYGSLSFSVSHIS